VYVRHKTIKGHRYYYLVEGARAGRRVKQRVIRYLGKRGGGSVISGGTGVQSATSLSIPPRVFTTDDPPREPAEPTPPEREQTPQKVTWLKRSKTNEPITQEEIKVGMLLQRVTRSKRKGRGFMGGYRYRLDEWVVTETSQWGYFKAIPRKTFDRAVRQATRTRWIGDLLLTYMVLTGHPPAWIILTWFANTDHAEYFTTASLDE
jgi:hypothetical protein